MRTLSAQEAALFAGGTRADCALYIRLLVTPWSDNEAPTVVDLANAPLGYPWTSNTRLNWIRSVRWGENVDDPVGSMTLSLVKEQQDISLSPLVGSSSMNWQDYTYQDPQGKMQIPLVDVGARVQLHVAQVPIGLGPDESDFHLLFDGSISTVDVGTDNTINVTARDLGGEFQDAYVEALRTYGSDAGVSVQSQMQQILSDNLYVYSGRWASWSLITQVSPGWNVTKWQQQKEPVLDALRKLAQQIGWDCRVKWHAGASAFRLQLFEPARTKTVADFTFTPGVVRTYQRATLDAKDIRNQVRIVYTDPTTKARNAYQTEDPTSEYRYGRRFMEIAEAASSLIDTQAEAQKLASAVLADLASPGIDGNVEVPFFFATELGDLYTFKADGRTFDTDQKLAVVAYEHEITGERSTTTLTVRGRPAGGYKLWLAREVRPGVASGTIDVTQGTPTNATGTGGMGSIEVTYDQPTAVTWAYSEFHVSTASGFTPTNATKKLEGRQTTFRLGGLTPGTTYYCKIIAVDTSGNRSAATGQVAVTASYVHDGATTRGANVDNIWPNPSSENAQPAGYTPPGTGFDAEFDFRDSGLPYAGSWGRKLQATFGASVGPVPVGNETHLGVKVACMPGDQFYIEAQAYTAAAPAGSTAGVWLFFLDASGSLVGSTGSLPATAAAWGKVAAVGKAPAGTVAVYLTLIAKAGAAGTVTTYFDAIYARRVVAGGVVSLQQATCTNINGLPTDGTYTLVSGTPFVFDSNWCNYDTSAYSVTPASPAAAKLYVKEAGLYLVQARVQVAWGTSGPTYIDLWARVSGGSKEFLQNGRNYGNAAPFYCWMQGATTLSVPAGAYIEFGIDFSGSSGLYLPGGYAASSLRVTRIG